MEIGNKIKQLREAAELSIEQLADASGVAEEQLEMIETGELTPSVAILVKVARSLGTRLGTFLEGIESNSPVVTTQKSLQPTVSTSNANVLSRENLSFYSLARQKSDRNMEPFMVTISYNVGDCAEASTHEGEEFIYVLQGCVILHYGKDLFELNVGDSIYYDSIVPHYYTTKSEDEVAQMLAVTYTPY